MPRLERLQPDVPVYYRGIEVGNVQNIQLGRDAAGVDIHVFVRRQYAVLVRLNSRFWVVTGADLKGGLFSGVHLKLDSLRRGLGRGGLRHPRHEDRGDGKRRRRFPAI